MIPIERSPIAIVGISCRLPGGADSRNELWELLKEGREAWSPVPADRFNEDAFHHPSADDPNGTSNHRGGHFIRGDTRDFDHAFFRLSPQQAAAMDPQQRMLLEMTHEVFEQAGWTRNRLAKSRTGVYTAMFTADYDRNLYKDPLDMPTYYSTGTEEAILSNRISHAFDLRGPSLTLDTACSGGLVALHQACQSLRDHESDAAIVASASLILSPDHQIGMSNLHMVSDTGRSYPFDARGEGYGRGEGLVVLAIKRLDDARRDRDPVLAVIRSTAVNQDGYTSAGITHPNGTAQADLIRFAYARAGLQPQDVTYVEAHGTGTVAGDEEELGALVDVFAGPDRTLPLYIGSMKGNIGHTECTSGLASLVKAALILEHQMVPQVAGYSTPKPTLPVDQICIPTELTPLECSRVSINSFGFGGTNAHAILEQADVAPYYNNIDESSRPRLFTFSANNQTSLTAMLRNYADLLEQADLPLADLSYTLCHRRFTLPWRFSCVADSRDALIGQLRQSSVVKPQKSNVIYVFTGQGAQWAGMGRELLSTPIFGASISTSRDILYELGATWDLEAELHSDSSLINTAEIAQPATTAIQIALVALLRAQGVTPTMVVGHSSGEIGAAYAAGYLSHQTALRIAYHRGFMAASSKTCGLPAGSMMSVGMGEHEVTPLLEGLAACVACVNSPSSTTLSGDADAIDAVAERLPEGTFNRRLLVDTAYHSHHMRAVADEYRQRLGEVEEHKSNITFISSVTGEAKTDGFDAEYWTTNLVSPVRFYDAVVAVGQRNHGHASFVEIGPHPALAGPVRQSLTDLNLEYSYEAPLQRKVDALNSALALSSRLFQRGIPLKLEPVVPVGAVLPDLPVYPWDHSTKHWHESRLSREYRWRREPYHDLLGVRIVDSTSIEPRWRHMVSLTTLPWIGDHIVDGLVIFPGTGYMCMAIEAVCQLHRERHSTSPQGIVLRNVAFLRALVMPAAPQRVELQLSLKPTGNGALSFSVAALSDGVWHEHCTGAVECIEGLTKVADVSTTSLADATEIAEIYDELAAAGNTYGPSFQGLSSLHVVPDASQGVAVASIPDTASFMPAQHQAAHLIHPTTLDIFFQTCLPMTGRYLHTKGSIMPVRVDELVVSGGALHKPGAELCIETSLTSPSFRTIISSLSASIDGTPVLSSSGVEMRSLADQQRANSEESGICYELEWQPDVDYVEAGKMADFVRHLCFKKADTSVIELGGSGELSKAFLEAVNASQGTMVSCDFLGDEETRGQLHHLVHFVDGSELPLNSYDVVMASSAEHDGRALDLLKPDGLLVRKVIESEAINIDLPAPTLPTRVRIIATERQPWFSTIVDGLRGRGIEVVIDTLGNDSSDPTLVIEGHVPLLSDPQSFNAVLALLQQPTPVVWLSPDLPAMHQITGIARVAHAENDDLRLTTVHAPIDALENKRLLGLLATCLSRDVHSEREYRMDTFGTIRIPRLRRSAPLNQAIAGLDISEPCRFLDASRPLVLDTERPVFVGLELASLGDTAIEIETEAFALRERLGEHVGTVTRVGAAVETFQPGDRVVALGQVGASCLRVPSTHASRLPDQVSSSLAAAAYLSILAACHALRVVESGTVLVHGALSTAGRAAVAVARARGLELVATAADGDEAAALEELGIVNVYVTRASLHRQQLPVLDAIISDNGVSDQILGRLKPFGHVLLLGHAPIGKVPPNVSIHTCNITDLLQAQPDHLVDLAAQATAALPYMTASNNLHVRDVSDILDAHRLMQTGVHSNIILTTSPDACVGAAPAGRVRSDASYVVAGGLGDLGRRLLVLLAKRGAMHLVTLSRRVIEPDDYASLQAQIQKAQPGCHLLCLQCDVTSESSTRDAAAAVVRSGMPAVRGVIQSTALLKDRTIASMNYDDFLSISRVKVQGTLNLAHVFTTGLDFFLMLSSAANILGTGGQANYNAGNAVQDALAQTHEGYVSLNIGWVGDAGHTLQNEVREQGLRRAGFRAIQPEELLRWFDCLITSHHPPSQAVIGFDTVSLSNATTANGNVRSAMFCHIRKTVAPLEPRFDKDTRADTITTAIKEQLARLVTADAANLDDDSSILDLGLDSLVSIELRNWVMREFDAPLQSSEIMIDQTIHDLAEKVAARSRRSVSDSSSEGDSSDTQLTSASSTCLAQELEPIPIPRLADTLALFENSRKAIDSTDEQRATAAAVTAFLNGEGPKLQQRLLESDPSTIADAYERQIYLERREPLHEYSEFFAGHPVDAPTHSQALRAAIVTVAAMDFAQRLATGDVPLDTLHDVPMTPEAREWLFYTTRRPSIGVDSMVHFAPNDTVAVLRQGHVFQLQLQGLDLGSVHASYQNILSVTEPLPSVCTLTADERDSWAKFHELLDEDALEAIESSAFVVCLDIESPLTAGERHMQFLLNGPQSFNNRWLDKSLQFAITANGMSALIGEHAKLDGLDVRTLHADVCHAILASAKPADAEAYPIKEFIFHPTPSMIQRISAIQKSAYIPLDHCYVDAEALGSVKLRTHRAAPSATAHLTVLLAAYLLDGAIRPAWEIASLGTFARGRIDWMQTVSPVVRAFIEAAASAEDSPVGLRSLFDAASSSHARLMTAAVRGRGFVNHMYALCSVADTLPDIFETHAWNATRRGGPDQDLKIGFMPDTENNSFWEEGSFLMEGERGVYVHCQVRETSTKFAISARKEYAAQMREALTMAATVMKQVLDSTPTTTKPDIELLTTEQLVHVSAQPERVVSHKHMADVELVGLCYIHKALEKLGDDTHTLSAHAQKYIRWMREQVRMFEDKTIPFYDPSWDTILADEAAQLVLIDRTARKSIDGLVATRLGPKIVDILTGRADMLSLLLEDGSLEKLYTEAIGTEVVNQYLSKYLELLSFKKPGLDILEIGAGTGGTTAIALNAMTEFRSYTYTDISPAFFVRARMRFKDWSHAMEFKTLDVEKDSSRERRYDVVIASNVLHATSQLEHTLKNVGKYLKPGGKLLLIELTRPLIRNAFGFGLLPGWWKSEEAWRHWGPLAPEGEWDSQLRRSGFTTGLDHAVHDFDSAARHMSMMVATYGASEPVAEVDIVGPQGEFETHLATTLSKKGVAAYIVEKPSRSACIFTGKSEPVDSGDCNMALWVTSGKKTLHSSKFTTLHLVSSPECQPEASAMLVCELFTHMVPRSAEEYVDRDQCLQIVRQVAK